MKKDPLELKIDLGSKERAKLCSFLQELLASSYSLYLKTQNFHWNVTGSSFHSYHLMFQDQYEELAGAIDEIAERVRALGYFSEGSFASFAGKSLVQDAKEGVSTPMKMIEILLEDHERVIRYLRKGLPLAENVGDGATADFINKRLAVHEKTAWMLRSTVTHI